MLQRRFRIGYTRAARIVGALLTGFRAFDEKTSKRLEVVNWTSWYNRTEFHHKEQDHERGSN